MISVLRILLERRHAAPTGTALVILMGCAAAKPPPPPVSMGISVPSRCYRVSMSEPAPKCEAPGDAPQAPVVASFRLDDVATPRSTDGVLEVVVSSKAFDPIRLSPLNLRLDDKPRPVEFVVTVPAEKADCSVFTVRLFAKAGSDVFEGEVESPCGG